MLVKDLRLFDKEYFFRNFWRDPAAFELLLSWLAPLIQKSSKRRLTAVTAERLCAPSLLSCNWRCTVHYSFQLSHRLYNFMPHCKRNNWSATENFIWKRLPRASKVGKRMAANWKRIGRSIEFFHTI